MEQIRQPTHKELLEGCAKAIGLDLTNWEYSEHDGFYHYTKNGTDYWNPLEDDWYCIDVITKLQLTIHSRHDGVVVYPYRHNETLYVWKAFSQFACSIDDGSRGAFRNAVVEAAYMIYRIKNGQLHLP